MKDLDLFQIIVIGAFMAAVIGAVIVFATTQSSSQRSESVEIAIWGTIESDVMERVIAAVNDQGGGLGGVTYRQIDSGSYYGQLTEAIATGRGPDLFLIDEAALHRQFEKLVVIPYETLPQQNFRATFVEAAEVFMIPQGVVAIPFRINPMVMYWNRSMFTNAGIAQPPRYWDELFTMAPKLTRINEEQEIEKSAVAFGAMSNVHNAKDTLSLLMLQAGTPIVEDTSRGWQAGLTGRYGQSEVPSVAALRFFTEFSDPVKSVYSWNRSLPSSRDAFIAGDLAMYFGFINEYRVIREQNPNLDIGVAPVPQLRGGDRRTTMAHVVGFAIPRVSRNASAAYNVARLLSSAAGIHAHTQESNLPPIRRDLVNQQQTQEFAAMAFDAALIAKTWVDPDYATTYRIFQTMVEDVTSGREEPGGAVRNANEALQRML